MKISWSDGPKLSFYCVSEIESRGFLRPELIHEQDLRKLYLTPFFTKTLGLGSTPLIPYCIPPNDVNQYAARH
jgi:hypothetical protein